LGGAHGIPSRCDNGKASWPTRCFPRQREVRTRRSGCSGSRASRGSAPTVAGQRRIRTGFPHGGRDE
jgi:hypothetical protein